MPKLDYPGFSYVCSIYIMYCDLQNAGDYSAQLCLMVRICNWSHSYQGSVVIIRLKDQFDYQ